MVHLVAPSCYYVISISVVLLLSMPVSCLLPGILFLLTAPDDSLYMDAHPDHCIIHSLLMSSTHSMFGYPSELLLSLPLLSSRYGL
jgi:hypothetical protein